MGREAVEEVEQSTLKQVEAALKSTPNRIPICGGVGRRRHGEAAGKRGDEAGERVAHMALHRVPCTSKSTEGSSISFGLKRRMSSINFLYMLNLKSSAVGGFRHRAGGGYVA